MESRVKPGLLLRGSAAVRGGTVKLEKGFVVGRSREALIPVFDDDATFTSLLPDTRIVSHTGKRRETSTPYNVMGQVREIRFIFESLPEGGMRFEKICDGNVWRSLQGEVRLEPEDGSSTRVVLRMEGRTRAFVPELAIRGPMREQIEDMARSLRARLESA